MPEAQAATVNQPVTVDKPGQNVTDDFDVKDCTAPAAVVIAASAAKTTDDVTNVGTKSITATFSNQNKADGIRVQADYPGTVKLADGLHIALTSDGNDYDTTGIILAGVDKSSDSKGSHDESVNANDEFIANGNKISDTRVEVGNGTSITVDAGLRKLEENENRNRVFAVGLENHFGHMKAGNDVTLSVNSGKFSQSKNTTYGFYQVFYGDTTIGDRLNSTVKSEVDAKTNHLVISAVTSAHDHPNDKQIKALTHDRLTLGDDAHLTSIVTATAETDKKQSIVQYGAYLSQTDYNIGRNMQIDTTQTGVKGAPNKDIGGEVYAIGIYTDHDAKGTIGAGLQDTVTVRDRAVGYVKGIYCGDTDVTLGDSSRITTQVENSNVLSDYGLHVRGTSKLTMGNNSQVSVRQQGGTTNTIRGAYVYPAATFTAGDNFRLDVAYGATNLNGTAYGILNEGTVNLGKNAHITVNAPDERAADTVAVYSYTGKSASANQVGKVTLDDGAVLTVNSKAENEDKIINNVVKTDKAGQVIFNGGMTLTGSQNAIYSTDAGSSVTALGNGRKVILGDLESAKGGAIKLNLNTGDSLFRGKSTIDGVIRN